MLKVNIIKHPLIFKRPSGTSRGVLSIKDSWFIKIFNNNQPEIFGLGECSIIKGLSYDDRPDLNKKMREFAKNPDIFDFETFKQFPALQFAIETALFDLKNGGTRILFPSDFTNSTATIPINGLIWMGKTDFLKQQIHRKIDAGFKCLKLKIGALDFESEINIIREIRKKYTSRDIELRLDANGAFEPHEALKKLEQLSKFEIQSIEQPIRAGQYEIMAALCKNSPIPIALDEELIGIIDTAKKKQIIEEIKPQYIILKPSLLGGYKQSENWIKLAKEKNIGWWITSALESNIGLNAIAQWTFTLNNPMPQGLGTGQLFSNNVPSPLEIKNGHLRFMTDQNWNLKILGL